MQINNFIIMQPNKGINNSYKIFKKTKNIYKKCAEQYTTLQEATKKTIRLIVEQKEEQTQKEEQELIYEDTIEYIEYENMLIKIEEQKEKINKQINEIKEFLQKQKYNKQIHKCINN